MSYILLPLIMIAVIAIPLYVAFRQKVSGRPVAAIKRTMIVNLCAFVLVAVAAVIIPFGGVAAAATAVDATNMSVGYGLVALGVALSTGLACVGAGIAVAAGSSAAIGAITEDPKIFGRAILFVGLGEGIAIYGILFSILLYIKL